MRKLIFTLAFGLLVLPNYGFTLGMGDIEVNSALNQQLDARIEVLSSSPEDAETLIINLASREEFARAGLDRPYGLSSLKFTPFVEGDKVYVRVTSPKPIREPFLNFLIEIDWPRGHLLREYTILLDPPVFMGQVETGTSRPAASQPESGFRSSTSQTGSSRPATISAAPVSSMQQAEAAVQPRSTTQAAVTQPVQQPSTYYSAPAPASQSAGEHRIQSGETAWGLANRLRPDSSVSVEQMMLAMLRTNPEVFINGNVNGLKRGYILRVPDRSDITSISQSEAIAAVRVQNALWREYQQALSSDIPASAISTEESRGMDDVAQSDVTGDGARLAIVSAGEGVSAAGEGKDPTEMTAAELREHLALVSERLETERLEKEELMGQVSSLQQQVGEMKNLLTIEDQALSDIQSLGETEEQAKAADEAAMAESEMAESDTFTSEEEAALKALEELTETASEDMAEAMQEEALVAEDEMAAEDAETMASEEALFVEDQTQVTETTSPVVEDYEVADDYTPYVAPTLLETLMNNKLVLGGAGLGAIIIAGLGYLLFKRRRDSADQEAEAGLAADLETGFDQAGTEDDLESIADSIDEEEVVSLSTEADEEEQVEVSLDEAEAASEDDFDSESTVVLSSAMDTVTQMPEVAAAEEEERDDVIAEADVYLAYGIFQQAEELLQNAITEHPEKEAYRVKLAETYFAGKNASAFENVAVDMKQQIGDEETPAWLKVVAMGKDLCPDADVFKQASSVADLDLDDLMPKSPEPVDLELGIEDEGEASELDMDFGADFDSGLDADLSLDETTVLEPAEASVADELEFDIGDAEAVDDSDDVTDLEEEFSLDITASELDIETPEQDVGSKAEATMDFDLGEPFAEEMLDSSEAVDALAEESLDDLSMDDLETDIDLSDELDLSGEMESEELDLSDADKASEEFELDLSTSLDEDLVTTSDDDELDLSDLDDVDEVSTKLDLARAYIDMGDSEGARDILDEVMIDGSDDQKKEAEALLKEMT